MYIYSAWKPGFDPAQVNIPVYLSAQQISCLHTIINNVFLEKEEDFNEDVANELLSLVNDLCDEHVTDNQVHAPCAGTVQHMQETN